MAPLTRHIPAWIQPSVRQMSLLFLTVFVPGSSELEPERAAGKEGKVSDRTGRVHLLVLQFAFQIIFSA